MKSKVNINRFFEKHIKFLFVKNAGSLKNKLFAFFFVLMLFIAILTSVILYLVFQNMMLNEIGSSRVDLLKQIGERTRVIKNSVITLSNLYCYDPQIYKVIDNYKAGDNLDNRFEEELRITASKYETAFKKIDLDFYVVIIGNNGFKYCSLQDSEQYNYNNTIKSLWYRDVLASKEDIFWVSSFNDSNDPGKSKYVFSAARLLKDGNTGEELGILLVNVEEKVLLNTYKSVLTSANSIYIVDEKGGFVSHRDERMLGINFYHMERLKEIFEDNKDFCTIKKGNNKILLSKYLDMETGWTIMEEIIFKELMLPFNKFRMVVLGVFAMCSFIAFVLSYSFSKKVANPLKNFCAVMDKVRRGDLDVISDIQGWNELRLLSEGFNQMLAEIKELLNDIKEKEKLKRKAELDFLQAQINPHFLYNTLFSIRCMVSMGNTVKARDMISSFVALLRKILENKDEFIMIEDEIDCLKHYIQIQKFRYSEKFEVVFDVQNDILHYRIPKLVLQPIIENSIIHGIEPKKGLGQIKVKIVRSDDDIVFKISDNGVGIDEDELKSILSSKEKVKGSQFTQVGIVNVNDRIQLNFGIKYGIKIWSKPGAGTETELIIPAIE